MRHLRTDFKFDQTPWKIVICPHHMLDCKEPRGNGHPTLLIAMLPEAPEPGRIPEGADHVHIVAKGSEERDAREQEKWRSLLFSTARCQHGRMQGDSCKGCKGFSPDSSEIIVGYTSKGNPVAIPQRKDMNDIKKWIVTED